MRQKSKEQKPTAETKRVCAECKVVGPRIKDKDWQGWSECGVEPIRPWLYRFASHCPKHAKTQDFYGAYSLDDLETKWRKHRESPR